MYLPRDAEFVDAHTEVGTPEHVRHGHHRGASFGQFGKQPVGFFPAVRADGNGEVVAGDERRRLRVDVAAHQHVGPYRQRYMHDEVAIAFQHIHFRRSLAIGEKFRELAAEYRAV